jgi:hypothetical protein
MNNAAANLSATSTTPQKGDRLAYGDREGVYLGWSHLGCYAVVEDGDEDTVVFYVPRWVKVLATAESRENSVWLASDENGVKVYEVVRAGFDFVVSVETGDKVKVTVEAAEGSEPPRAAKMGARRMARKAATGSARG